MCKHSFGSNALTGRFLGLVQHGSNKVKTASDSEAPLVVPLFSVPGHSSAAANENLAEAPGKREKVVSPSKWQLELSEEAAPTYLTSPPPIPFYLQQILPRPEDSQKTVPREMPTWEGHTRTRPSVLRLPRVPVFARRGQGWQWQQIQCGQCEPGQCGKACLYPCAPTHIFTLAKLGPFLMAIACG